MPRRSKWWSFQVITITTPTFHLGCALECYFHKYTDVEVDTRPMVRKYQQFGQRLHTCTRTVTRVDGPDFPALFAGEVPKMCGAWRVPRNPDGRQPRGEDGRATRGHHFPSRCPSSALACYRSHFENWILRLTVQDPDL